MNPSSLKLRRTGKIALLLTILCAGQMYGMEPTSPVPYEASSEVRVDELRRTGPLYPERGTMGALEELPQDVHNEIIRMAIASSNTLEEAIQAIKVASVLRGVRYNYDNLKDLTHIVDILSNIFPDMPKLIIATKINRQLAKEYFKTLASSKPFIAKNKQQALEILGLHEGASQADITRTYRRLALLWHPDKNNDEEKDYVQEVFKVIQSAYDFFK